MWRQSTDRGDRGTHLSDLQVPVVKWLINGPDFPDYCTNKASTAPPLPPPLVVVACNAYVHKGCDFDSRPAHLYLLPRTFSRFGSQWEEKQYGQKLATSEGKNIIKKEAGFSAAVKKWTIRKVTWEREWLE